MELYPLKFQPRYHYRIWGGNKLSSELNKDCQEASIGESWEISDVEGNETVVAEGALAGHSLKALIQSYTVDFVGKKGYQQFGDDFPLLIKFIDAAKPLSIQVHPDDELARKRHDSFGKNEMWYVMQADPGAELIVGFNQVVTRDQYIQHLEDGTVTDLLNTENVSKGDTYYIPTGRVHAIGAGVLLAEIQQTSNVTYRIYDYDRVDITTGNKRTLHTELALDAIDFTPAEHYKTSYDKTPNTASKLVYSPYFRTAILPLTGPLDRDYSSLDSFVIYICVEGSLDLIYKDQVYHLKLGETLLLPASIDRVSLQSTEAVILEVSL